MYSIRAKILSIALLFIASIGVTFVVYSMITTVRYKRLRLDSIEKTVQVETEKVNRIVSVIERGAKFYAIGGKLIFQIQQEEFGEKLAIEFLSNLPMAVGGGLWFEPYAYKKDRLREGFYAFYDKESGKIRLDDTFFMDEYDYHNKSWYREIADSIKEPYHVAWAKPYLDDSGSFSLMTTAGSGVFDENGKLIALSIVDWEIDEVVKELTAIKPTENSFVLLCVPEKDYVISSTRTRLLTGAGMESIPWDITAGTFDLDGITYMRFSRTMDNGWFLSIQIPEKEIFAEVEKQNSRFSKIIATASILLLLLAFLLISKLINKPIKQLIFAVSQLAEGNLDTQIKISSHDELSLLADTFNKMTGELKKSIEENAHERTEKQRINTELSVASSIQLSMLPSIFPPFPERTEFDIYASMTPAREVGGDFYDFFFVDKDNLVVVIADVSGKGIPAALFMVTAKTLINNNSSWKSPAAVFENVNKKLCENNEMGLFVTAIIGFYNIPTGRFVFVNAGHNPPLLSRNGKNYEFVRTEPCIVLAFMEDIKYREEELYLQPGDVFYLYTDGITEAMSHDMELFGEQRLINALNKNKDRSPQELLHAIKREVDNYADGTEQADDITMLALKIYENADNSVKKFKLQAKVENLSRLIDFVNTELKKSGCPPDLQDQINVAVEEIFVNIANYAYKPDAGDVTLSISIGNKVVVKFEDTGKPYNPLEQADPDLETDLSSREIGGLGIYLVKKLVDSIEYSRVDDNNVLVITKGLL
ncbi:MAG: SpoIIE family protein phosphatase [Treponema sp.]|nr:SpoIIE family protein phosphatase [Treponema sp.]